MSRKKKMTLLILGTLLVLVAIFAALWFVMHRTNPQLPEQTITVNGTTFTVEIASTMLQQTTGLSYRPSLASDHGMLFIFPRPAIQNFWMKDMNFPLDMIWIGDGKVVGFVQNAAVPVPGAQLWQLPIYSSPDGTDEVLEVVAGTVAKDNIQIGDSVTLSG